MSGGYNGRILRINLSSGRISREEMKEEDVRKFIGGRGLGAFLLYKELKGGIDPLGKENKLIFTTGPLTGLGVQGSAKYAVLTKSPLTNIYLMSISSRNFGIDLRKSGYDVLIVEGVADKPVYISIFDNQVSINDAQKLWGMETFSAEESLLREGENKKASVATIGPAGENLVKYASIMNNNSRTAGRGGAGAVMGSKKLKAIVVKGSGIVSPVSPVAFNEAKQTVLEKLKTAPHVKKFQEKGTVVSIEELYPIGAEPCLNWQVNTFEGIENLFPEAMKKHIIKSKNCPPCLIQCGKLCSAEWEKEKVISEGPEYETAYSFGTCCGYNDYNAVITADKWCDRLGMDTMSAGVSLSFVMECFEKGLISTADTNGREFKFGNKDLLPKVLEDIAYRRGFGDFLAEGTRYMAKKIGKGSEKFAMHAKGLELGGYDPRAIKGMALVFACGPRGGCHHAGGRPINEELAGDPLTPYNKGDMVKKSRENRVAFDSSIICTYHASMGLELLAKLISAATGWDYDAAGLLEAGDRISNLERMFNVREGIRRAQDTLPARLLTESISESPSKGQVVELDILLNDFYRACGWDNTTGVPLKEKLEELGLIEYL